MTARTMMARVKVITDCKNDAALAAVTGLSSSVVCRMLSGEYGPGMKVDTMLRISRSTEISMDDLAQWWAEGEKNGT